MKKLFLIISAFFIVNSISSQTTINQNGIQTTVIGPLSAEATQAKSYEIANISYNSYHWQYGGLIIIEIYQSYFATDYQKYILENGFEQGVNVGSPILKLVESHGIQHLGKITLGTPVDLNSTYGGAINKQLPILFNIQNYAVYNVKITYLQQKVNMVDGFNQIQINETPVGTNIPNFSVPTELDANVITNGVLRIRGEGNHYIQNGNLGIGTTNPTSKLTVAGNIASREVKVTVDAGADFVFESNYNLPSLDSVDKFIKENKHLPEIASAEEMKKDGINLSEMNIKLLQKMEEMTLYMIEQNKQMQDQQKEISELKKDNTDLKEIKNRLLKLEKK